MKTLSGAVLGNLFLNVAERKIVLSSPKQCPLLLVLLRVCLSLLSLVLEPEEQLGTLQLLIYLLPPCNCDTLHRLLQFLSIVARHAEDNVSKDGQEVCYHEGVTSFQFSIHYSVTVMAKTINMTIHFNWESHRPSTCTSYMSPDFNKKTNK